MNSVDPVSHLPAEAVTIGTVRRTVCAWCGELLEEINLVNAYSLPAGDAIPGFSSEVWGRFAGKDSDGSWWSYAQVGPEPPEDACCR